LTRLRISIEQQSQVEIGRVDWAWEWVLEGQVGTRPEYPRIGQGLNPSI